MNISLRMEITGDDPWSSETLGGMTTNLVIDVKKIFHEIEKHEAIACVIEDLILRLETPRPILLLAYLIGECSVLEGDCEFPSEIRMREAANEVIGDWGRIDGDIKDQVRPGPDAD